jgi:hypothetical protein
MRVVLRIKKGRRTAETAMAPKPPQALTRKAKRGRLATTQRDIRALLVRMNYEGLKSLRQLALDKDRTIQSLGVEAFNDLLRKYGAEPNVKNPLYGDDAER